MPGFLASTPVLYWRPLEIFQKVYGTDHVFTAQELERLRQVTELIVGEGSKIADDWVNDKDNGENYPSEMIKQHFGVEE